MTYMMCRTRVSDFSVWRAVFVSHAQAHRDAGLTLVNMWRSIEEPNNVFFIFEVESVDRADRVIKSPESAKAGETSGVIDGEYHFVESTPGY